MTQQTKEFIQKLIQLPEAVQIRFINRWTEEIEGGDGAIDEAELIDSTVPTYEDIKHLMGSYKDLPADLSSNPRKYMKNFGAKSMGTKD